MSQHGFVPTRAIPPLISRKKKSEDKSECTRCQKKARVSEPGDPLEHEADRAADAVMNRKPVPSLSAAGPQYQRRAQDKATTSHEEPDPSSIHHPAAKAEPAKKLDGAAPLQRKARQGEVQLSDSVFEALEDHGTPLDPATLHFMQERFGRDFSQVRIHTGVHGDQAASAIQARAFTHGKHVVFGSGEYHPGTQSGKQLLAHELAHVAQQGAAPARAAIPAAHWSHASVGITPPISVAQPNVVARQREPAKEDDVNVPALGDFPGGRVHVTPDRDPKNPRNGGPFNLAYSVSQLVVPASKGEGALEMYVALASKQEKTSRALAATVGRLNSDDDPQIAFKEDRDDAADLRDSWLDKVKWPRDPKKAADYWEDAGGDSGSNNFYKVGGKMCQTDHIVELQIGGSNAKENLRPLDAAMNSHAGRTLWLELWSIARTIKKNTQFGASKAREIQLTFESAVMRDLGKAQESFKKEKKKAVTCLDVQKAACCVDVNAADIPKYETVDYPIATTGGRKTVLRVPKSYAKSKEKEPIKLEDFDNAAAMTFLPGFVLKTLQRGKNDDDTIGAAIDKSRGTRLPLTFGDAKTERGNAPFLIDVNRSTGKLASYEAMKKKNKNLPIDYKFMSPGAVTGVALTDDGMEFTGYIKPSLPFLKKLDIKYEKEVLSLSKALVPNDYELPIPGAKVTKANIALILSPELKAEGTLGIEYGKGQRKIMEGELKATVDGGGFRLGGILNVFIPGVENATATFEYTKDAGWSGSGKVSLADLQKKLKYVRSGEVGIGFRQVKDGKIDIEASGKVMLNIPSTDGVEVSLVKNKDGWKFQGKGTFNIPKMKPVDIDIAYDGEHLSGEARGIGFKYKDFDVSITVRYKDEQFSGDGTAHFKKGRAEGKLKIQLLPTGKFAGSGSLTLAVREGVEATAGVTLDKDEKLHVDGKLAFAKPIKLFEGFKGDATLLKVGVSIPIPGLSVGVVGVNARIEGQLDAGYQIGPGEVRNASAEAKFDPLEDDPNLSIEIKGQVWIGASAYIKGAISGLIEVSAGVASVSGGLKVSAMATLHGQVLSNISLFYAKGRYEAKADFDASLALAIRLALEALVKAEAGVGPFKVATERAWTLAAKEFDTGMKLGIKVTKPLMYSSDKGLDVPGPSDIEVTKPSLDPAKLIDNVMGATSPKDKPR